MRKLTSDDSKGLVVTRVTESNADTRRKGETVDVLAGNIKGNRHGEEGAIGKTESVNDTAGTYETCPDIQKP